MSDATRPRLKPFLQTARNRYSRLLAPDSGAATAASDASLERLAILMNDKDIAGPAATAQDLIPAGYTYFGQFIDHDMTHDTSALADYTGELKPEELPNYRTCALNLENTYGEGPGSRDSALYEDDNVSFSLGRFDDGSACDVPLDDGAGGCLGRPLAADPRNLENALVRQVHTLFLKLHNIAADNLIHSSIHDRFAAARQRVTHQYQWLVRHDFLPRICDPLVYKKIITDSDPLIDWGNRFSIPVEFAQAAFRFGHSMVRSEYGLGPTNVSVNIRTLLKGKDATGPLHANQKIKWARFLQAGDASAGAELAMPINTSIIPEFFSLSSEEIKTFVRVKPGPREIFALPLRTMKRGAMLRLPSGQRAAEAFGEHELWPGSQAWANLVDCGLRDSTPLWYYILLEAEIKAGGARLGPLGSRIIAEVIEGALWANPRSFLRQYGRYWKPPPWRTPLGMKPIGSLYDLAVVTGLAESSGN